MNKYALLNTVFSAIGGAIIGGAIVMVVTKKHYETFANEEIEKIRMHYALIRKDQNVVTILGDMPEEDSEDDSETVGTENPGESNPLETRQAAQNLINQLGYQGSEPADGNNSIPTSESIETSKSIFEHAVSEDEVGDEVDGPNGQPRRTKSGRKPVIVTGRDPEDDITPGMEGYSFIPGEPYIISQSDMFNTENEWEKPTLSYYEGDDTLVDERNNLIDDTHRERYVGSRHLNMFGVLSEDENIVYVRSPQISTDFEIILEPGKYSVRVLGEPDYEEADKQRLRRMRDSD